MTKREVVRLVLEGKKPPYVPWHFGFTVEPYQMLVEHFGGAEALERHLDNHTLGLGTGILMTQDIGNGRVRDNFGNVWNRSVDKDIGIVEKPALDKPSLKGYQFPDPLDETIFANLDGHIRRHPDLFRVYHIGFSLFERAWTMRGMENLLMDFVEHPDFVEELFTRIADFNIAMVRKAVTYDIDAVYFGDD